MPMDKETAKMSLKERANNVRETLTNYCAVLQSQNQCPGGVKFIKANGDCPFIKAKINCDIRALKKEVAEIGSQLAVKQGSRETGIYSEERLQKYVDTLNGISGAHTWNEWKQVRAGKKYVDVFGVPIKPGEYYYKRKTGPNKPDAVILSRLSMDRLVFSLFDHNDNLANNLSKLRRERDREFIEAHLKNSYLMRK
ncbi:hypothetical protein [Desulfotruncus alcoholivorax]|uniref:hypothetical protein n=1 Tax=Desulfotruncus alcoholivorax TaxID=265477 RepID=UPI00041C4E37|nr:hypothetical protein [Desulfotruncus alcoholivorax]